MINGGHGTDPPPISPGSGDVICDVGGPLSLSHGLVPVCVLCFPFLLSRPRGSVVAMASQSASASSFIEDDFCYSTNVASSHIYVRMGFLRKVYGILSTQLLLTAAVSAAFLSMSEAADFVKRNPILLIAMLVTSLGLIVALHVKRHQHPTNLFLLLAFTLVEAFTVGVVVTLYDVAVVIQAFVLTIVTFVGLTAFTLQSKRDFSTWGTGLFVGLCMLLGSVFLRLFLHSDTLELMIAVAGAIIFCGFILYDTHMLMKKLSPEEHIVAAVNLYLDIINLFLYLLRIIGEMKRK
uniref:Transmembrane BAX inhibitor motif containing 4 n=1 Tax=Eptatretus burgeri TaxID=7764 RepID=A0A8C4QIR9_EPTBU